MTRLALLLLLLAFLCAFYFLGLGEFLFPDLFLNNREDIAELLITGAR